MEKPRKGKEIPFNYPFAEPRAAVAFDQLYQGLKKFNPSFEQSIMTDIASYCQHVIFPKGATIVKHGEVCEHVYFCIKGLVTSIGLKKGEEFNLWFMTDGDMFISVRSFFYQERSAQKLRALEKTECIILNIKDLNMLRQKHPSFEYTELLITRHYYVLCEDRNFWLHFDALNRYLLLREQYPHIVTRVSKVALASHLGISRTHLTDIMKNNSPK